MNMKRLIRLAAAISILCLIVFACSCGKAPVLPENVSGQDNKDTPQPVITDVPELTEGPEISGEPAAPDRVLLVGESWYAGPSDMDPMPVRTVDPDKAGAEKTIEFAGVTYDLVYRNTITFVMMNDISADEYSIVGRAESSIVRILPDDTVIEISTVEDEERICTVDIKDCADDQALRAAVENALSGEIDFGRFESFSITVPDETGSVYDLLWENRKAGMSTDDSVTVSMTDDGGVYMVSIASAACSGAAELPDDIDVENLDRLLEGRLRELFPDGTLNYDITSRSLKVIGGQPYMYCRVEVESVTEEYTHNDLCMLAVPIVP